MVGSKYVFAKIRGEDELKNPGQFYPLAAGFCAPGRKLFGVFASPLRGTRVKFITKVISEARNSRIRKYVRKPPKMAVADNGKTKRLVDNH